MIALVSLATRSQQKQNPGTFRLCARDEEQIAEYNPDGSLTIYLGNESPGKDKESNWSSGNFSIWLRAYWPDQAVLDDT